MEPTLRDLWANRRSRIVMIVVGTFLTAVFIVAFVWGFTD